MIMDNVSSCLGRLGISLGIADGILCESLHTEVAKTQPPFALALEICRFVPDVGYFENKRVYEHGANLHESAMFGNFGEFMRTASYLRIPSVVPQ